MKKMCNKYNFKRDITSRKWFSIHADQKQQLKKFINQKLIFFLSYSKINKLNQLIDKFVRSNKKEFKEDTECQHKNLRQEGGFFVCPDCGLIDKNQITFEQSPAPDFYSDSQLEYERKIRVNDQKIMLARLFRMLQAKSMAVMKW